MQWHIPLSVPTLNIRPSAVTEQKCAHGQTKIGRTWTTVTMLDGEMQRRCTMAKLIKIPSSATQQELERCKLLLPDGHMDAMLSSTTMTSKQSDLQQGQRPRRKCRLDIILELPS